MHSYFSRSLYRFAHRQIRAITVFFSDNLFREPRCGGRMILKQAGTITLTHTPPPSYLSRSIYRLTRTQDSLDNRFFSDSLLREPRCGGGVILKQGGTTNYIDPHTTHAFLPF